MGRLVAVVLVGVVGGGVALPVEAAINEVVSGSVSFMAWWREMGCHFTKWAVVDISSRAFFFTNVIGAYVF